MGGGRAYLLHSLMARTGCEVHVLVSSAAVTSTPTGGFANRNTVPTVSEARTPSAPSLPSRCDFTRPFPLTCVCVLIPSYKDAGHTGSGLPFLPPFNLVTTVKILSLNTVPS